MADRRRRDPRARPPRPDARREAARRRAAPPGGVLQAKRGIGDVIWHLPFVRAIAAVSSGGQVTFLAPPSSGAKELLAAEPSVAETGYFGNSGSQLRRGLNH